MWVPTKFWAYFSFSRGSGEVGEKRGVRNKPNEKTPPLPGCPSAILL